MAASDYRLLNRLLVIGLLACLLFLFIKSFSDPVMCVYLTTTGEYCIGCGLTRDFHSFMKLDFDNPIGTGSIPLFAFYLSQLCLRSIFAISRIRPETTTNIVPSKVLFFDVAVTLGGAVGVVLSFCVN